MDHRRSARAATPRWRRWPSSSRCSTPTGTVTAGNAPGLNDGAGALVVASAAYAKAHGLKPLARILGYGEAAWDTPYLAYTPAMAAQNALKRLGLTVDDLDLVEINEAFASVAIISARRLGVDPEIVNVNGGAIALGHPIGASGARLLMTLIYELRRRGGGIGLAAICSGTAQGDADGAAGGLAKIPGKFCTLQGRV